jgi:hypothetical protein
VEETLGELALWRFAWVVLTEMKSEGEVATLPISLHIKDIIIQMIFQQPHHADFYGSAFPEHLETRNSSCFLCRRGWNDYVMRSAMNMSISR